MVTIPPIYWTGRFYDEANPVPETLRDVDVVVLPASMFTDVRPPWRLVRVDDHPSPWDLRDGVADPVEIIDELTLKSTP